MPGTTLENHAKEIIQKTGFIVDSTLQFATTYDGSPRSLVYGGVYKGQPAVFKIYNKTGRQLVRQPENALEFASGNASSRMHVPELFAYEVESSESGWMIMERVPETAQMFTSPLNDRQRQEFLQAFFEYRSHMSLMSPWPIGKIDKRYIKDGGSISGAEFHALRITSWKKMAEAADAEYVQQGKDALLTEVLQEDIQTALGMIETAFANQPLYWCHGHFKPNEIHINSATGNFWITDFGHMALFPRGYEFAFMIWADVLMEFGGEHVNITAIAHHEDPSQQRIQAQAEHGIISYAAYRQRVIDWISAYNTEVTRFMDESEQVSVTPDVRQALVLEKGIQMAALLERILGSLYADTIARVEVPYEQKQERVALFQQLLHEIVNDTLFDL